MKDTLFDWTKGRGAQLIRNIAEDATRSELEDNTVHLARILKEHWWGINPETPLLSGWDQDVIKDFASTFGLEPRFGDWGLSVLLTKKP